MNKTFLFLGLLTTGFLLSIGIIFFTTRHQKNHQDQPIQALQQNDSTLVVTTTQPTITIKDIVLKEHGKNKHYELTVKAKESTVYHATNKIECKNVACTITHQRKPIAQLTAEKSLVDRLGKNVIFAGPVKGTFKDIAMQGRDINYNFSQQCITTYQHATYNHASFNLSAQQSFVDIKAQKIILKNGVRSEFSYRPTADKSGN
mgnify:CR=1 FL=1